MMSAFVMSERFFDRLAAELSAHATLRHSKLNWAVNRVLDLNSDGLLGFEERIQLFVTDCYKLNIRAVNYRYRQNDQPRPLRFIQIGSAPKWSDEQFCKYLECLSYQCAEGDCENDATYQKLEQLLGFIARSIVSESQNYKQAQWDYAHAA